MQYLELFDARLLELFDCGPAVVRSVPGSCGGYENDLGVRSARELDEPPVDRPVELSTARGDNRAVARANAGTRTTLGGRLARARGEKKAGDERG